MKPYPLLTKNFIEFFIKKDLSEKVLLELGSGLSTIFWADYFRKVYTYESDPNWIKKLEEYGIPKNVELTLVKDNLFPFPNPLFTEHSFISQIKNSDYVIIDNDSTPISRIDYAKFITLHKKEESQIILDNGTWQPIVYKFLQENFFCRDFPGTNIDKQINVTSLFFERKTEKYDYIHYLK
tara:strand:+ start:156 stop:698 length:543 start_codon:yes stop_codon:yes gene_type:complete